MKKTSLIFVALIGLAFNQAMAQIEAGKVFAGGGIGISTSSSKSTFGGTTNDGPKSTTFNFTPVGGYFLSENIAVGLGLGLSNTTTKADVAGTEVKVTNSSFVIAPFARYYASMGEGFYGFGEGSLGIGSGTRKSNAGGTTNTLDQTSSFGFNLAAGFNYFPAANYGFEFKLALFGINTFTDKDPANNANKDVSTTFNFGFNTFSPSIGFFYFF